MFWNAKSGSVHIDNTEMDYITFGMGKENLVMIPGLGDGLTTVKGMAAILAFTYKSYAKDYKVYIFSRKNNFERKIQSFQSIYSTREMAKDLAFALNTLGIIQTNVLGISRGKLTIQHSLTNLFWLSHYQNKMKLFRQFLITGFSSQKRAITSH